MTDQRFGFIKNALWFFAPFNWSETENFTMIINAIALPGVALSTTSRQLDSNNSSAIGDPQ